MWKVYNSYNTAEFLPCDPCVTEAKPNDADLQKKGKPALEKKKPLTP